MNEYSKILKCIKNINNMVSAMNYRWKHAFPDLLKFLVLILVSLKLYGSLKNDQFLVEKSKAST